MNPLYNYDLQNYNKITKWQHFLMFFFLNNQRIAKFLQQSKKNTLP